MQEIQETWVQSLDQEDLLEKGKATHSSILAWRIMDRGAWRATVHSVSQSRTDVTKHIPPQPPMGLNLSDK